MQNKPRLTLHARSRSVVIGIILVLAVSAKAATVTVTSTADPGGSCPGSNCTLRQAIATAGAGDTIEFAVTGEIKLTNGELGISRYLTITGPDVAGGSPVLTINADNRSRAFNVTGGTVTISNLGIRNGYVAGTNVSSGSGGDGEGGGIYAGADATLTLRNCEIRDNYVQGGLGGKNTDFSASGGEGRGGGIANRGQLTLQNCSIHGNQARGGYGGQGGVSGGSGYGAGVFSGGNGYLSMDSCTVYSNEAVGGPSGPTSRSGTAHGGGVANGKQDNGIYRCTFTMTNCTISQNYAVGADAGGGSVYGGYAQGGGVYSYTDGLDAKMTNCTVVDNIVNDGTSSIKIDLRSVGAGVAAERGGLQLSNTLLTRNTASGNNTSVLWDVERYVVSAGYNFVSAGDGASNPGWQSSDNIGTAKAPLDAQLLDYHFFGMQRIYRLKPTSAAIDAGNSPLAVDGRGAPRPIDQPSVQNAPGGNGSDIGAYELRTPTTFVVTNTKDFGAGSLRQAIADANGEDTLDSIIFNIPTSDPGYDPSTQDYLITLTSGELSITTPMSIDGGNAHISLLRSYSATPFRLFFVTSADGVTIANLFLRNGAAVGGPSAPGLGGGVANTGTLTLWNCTFSEDSATGGAGTPQVFQGPPGGDGLGGAIYNDGTLVMTNCTLFRNSAQGGAGGTGLSSSGVSSRGGNGGNGNGGGLFSNNGLVTITNCTFNQNSTAGGAPGTGDTYGAAGTTLGGGAAFARGSVGLRNTILSGNTAASNPDLYGTVTSTANLIGGTPKLGVLASNGGPTPTLALLAGSPAIDAGDGTVAPPTDQRGYPRVGAPDIGAFEFGSTAPAATPTPTPTATPNPSPTAAPPATVLGNISTRLRVETGDNVLIGGFIVTGTQPKKVIIRGIGPSLPFADKLANPTLELYGPNGLIDSNDNWVDSPNKQAIIDSTVPPSNDLEAAIVAVLPANNAGYTAIVRGANNTTGIGVVEAYDLGRSVDSKLANISTRGFVSTGDNVLIAGTIVVGSNSQKVIVRAIGPSLPIAGALANPTLELRDSNGGLIEANDNWVDSPNKQAIIDSTIPPSNDLESAIVAVLPANNASYTAIVRGVNNTTGIAVVEVYALH